MKSVMITLLTLASINTQAIPRNPFEVLRNTKELESAWISDADVTAANSRLLGDQKTIADLQPVFRETIEKHPWELPCEGTFIHDVGTSLQKYGFAADEAATRAALVLFRNEDWIDDLILEPLLTAISGTSETTNAGCSGDHAFQDNYESMSIAKDRNPPPRKDDPSLFLTQRRAGLYDQYSGLQIGLLSEVFTRFSKRMLALSAEIRIHHQDKSIEEYPLSPQEQYRMAAKMLHKEMEELKISSLFSGTSPSLQTVIAAGVETGAISPQDVDAVLNVEDLWNPKTPKWLKTYRVISKFVLPSLIFVPAPGNLISALAVAIVEAVVTTKSKPNPNPEDLGITIF